MIRGQKESIHRHRRYEWFDLFGLESFFSSMSRAEFFDIQDVGWRACENGMSGKWFADSFEDAIIFGQRMGHGVDPKFYVVEVDILEDIPESVKFIFQRPLKRS